jgi:phospholipid-binding lipoprotein MlaA
MKKYILIFTLCHISFINAFSNNINIFSTENQIQEATQIHDPFEKINRKIYKFNLVMDKYSTKPLAKLYQKTTTNKMRISVNNFFSNLYMPVTIVNSLLQTDLKNFARASRDFFINSTIGILGLFNPAENSFKFKKARKEDFAQTLGKYNVGTGPYLMLPILGPSSLRGFTGNIADTPLNPIWHNNENSFTETKYMITALDIISKREKLLLYLDDIEKNSLDPYSVIKSAYFQRTNKMVNNEIN